MSGTKALLTSGGQWSARWQQSLCFWFGIGVPEKFEASGKFRLCLCKDLLQLYESKGKELTKDDVAGSTFVHLKAEGQDFEFVKGDGKGRKGKRAKAGKHARRSNWFDLPKLLQQ